MTLGEVGRAGEFVVLLALLFILLLLLAVVVPVWTERLLNALVCWAAATAAALGEPDLGEGLVRLGLREPLEFTLE